MEERTGLTSINGRPLTLLGPELKKGDSAPAFTALDRELQPVSLSDYRGKVTIIISLPSLDTPVCDLETRRFSNEVLSLKADINILAVSMDLPFAQKRWCVAHGLEHVVTLSDHREASFGEAYGVLIKDMRLLARAVFVIDRDQRISYLEIVSDLGREPDYSAAVQAAFDASKS